MKADEKEEEEEEEHSRLMCHVFDDKWMWNANGKFNAQKMDRKLRDKKASVNRRRNWPSKSVGVCVCVCAGACICVNSMFAVIESMRKILQISIVAHRI